MKASETTILKFLEGKNQFIIPIFQRTYSWKIKQSGQLWEDIVRVANEEQGFGHFIGSIVFIQDRLYQSTRPQPLLVIDGQQRLTTIMLLLTAIGKHIQEVGGASEITREKINDYYIFNGHEKGDDRYKLILTQTDQETLKCLLDGKELPDNASTRIIENYEFFREQLLKSGLSMDAVFRGIERLFVVEISLDRISDDPQLIFESLNSTGMDLSQSDLIRNYVLMGLKQDEQESLYKDYWHPMEERLSSDKYEKLLDMFMRDYITMKTGHIPNINEIYFAFKMYVSRLNISIRQILEDIAKFSKYYYNMAIEGEEDNVLRDIFENINSLEVYVSYPFLLMAYDDYKNNKISMEQFIEILELVESYVFRRSICGIPTNSMNKTFATLYREIDQDDYIESLKYALLSKSSYKRFPHDEEFIKEFVVKDVYHTRICGYILSKFENIKHKEKITLTDYTIEHILPQNENLPVEWQKDLGPNWKEIQKKYLHTIGNLTLTGYNPEMSDRPFIEKRDCEAGFKQSHLRLNHTLADLDHWDETKIISRAAELAGKAIKIWQLPATSYILVIPESEQKGTIAINEINNFFPSNDDFSAAKQLVKDLFDTIEYEKIKSIVSVFFNGRDQISIIIGPWLVLYFKRNYGSIITGFCIDRSVYPEDTIEFIGTFHLAPRYSGGKTFDIPSIQWDHTIVTPDDFMQAWRAGLRYASEKFKDWHSSPYKAKHQEELVQLLLNVQS